MKAMLGRVFARKEEPSAPQVQAVSSELTNSDIENYYLRIIADCLKRMLVPSDAIEVGVKRAGIGPTGLTAFAGYVRILKWDPVLTPVLLQNMAVIDARIRKVVAASVILEHTHFSGLWFQSTDTTEGAPRVLVGLPAELIHQSGNPAAAAA
ncbi:MAG: hypothetical protein HYX47_24130 [Burkholderiales bacterium]|nr:hypothetical protein [Burkholderiales bacterium]